MPDPFEQFIQAFVEAFPKAFTDAFNSAAEQSGCNFKIKFTAPRQAPKPKAISKEESLHHQVIDHWTSIYESVLGCKYPFDGPKEANIVKTLIKKHGVAIVMSRMNGYLAAWKSYWPHNVKGEEGLPTLALLSSQFAKIRPQLLPPAGKMKTATDDEIRSLFSSGGNNGQTEKSRV